MEYRLKNIFWVGVAVITGTSLGVTFYAPINDVFRGVSSLPATGGLAIALFQLVRDHSAHQRKLQLQNEQQLFNLGATSHMANTVFDKHVEFSELYLREVHQLVITLTKEGPTQNALEHAGNLYKLRINYTAWITPEIDAKLMPFEQATRKIGAQAYLIEALSGEEDQEGTRSKAVTDMYDIFMSFMNIGDSANKDADTTVIEVKNRIRQILQVKELVGVREFLISKAAFVANTAYK
jgi:hypothetical protein